MSKTISKQKLIANKT